MVYIKIINKNDEAVRVEAIEHPLYVKMLPGGDHRLCPKIDAGGILSKDSMEVYQLSGGVGLTFPGLVAVEIPYAEYVSLKSTDSEDESPVFEDDIPPQEILTRAELTAKVAELEEQNALLMECVLEMSEAVYA